MRLGKARAILINVKDNVATALQYIKAGEVVEILGGKEVKTVLAKQSIPFGHKIALKKIGEGEFVVKYGEVIGRATQSIEEGEYVHVHNVESIRGRGDVIDE